MATNFGSGKGGVYDNSSAALYGGMNTAGTAGNVFARLAGYNPTSVYDPATIASGIDGYMNPYTEGVIDRTMGDIDRTRMMQQNENAAAAVKAGAFGGSRHGVVEAQTNEAALRTMGDASANLRSAGFNTAAQLSGQDILNKMGASDSRIGAIGMDFNNQLNAAGGLLDTAQTGGGLAETAFGMGNSITGQQMQQGTFLQQLQQMIMDRAGGQFDATTGQPRSLLDSTMAALGMSPLGNESKTTGQYTPGMFDYISLIAQSVGAAKGMK
jgi:uncharacterized protein YfiM (DUF2279 family)